MIVAHPEIKTFEIKRNNDFIVLGCKHHPPAARRPPLALNFLGDGIFDKVTSTEAVKCIGNTLFTSRTDRDDDAETDTDVNVATAVPLRNRCGEAVNSLMDLSLKKKTLDNITVIVIALQNSEHSKQKP